MQLLLGHLLRMWTELLFRSRSQQVLLRRRKHLRQRRLLRRRRLQLRKKQLKAAAAPLPSVVRSLKDWLNIGEA